MKAELNGWGLQFSPNLLSIKARVLQPENINQQDKQVFIIVYI